MKRKVILIGLLSTLIGAGVVSARCVGPVVNGECLGTEVYGSEDDESTEERYSGASGSSYQYVLNDPKDRNAYNIYISIDQWSIEA